MRILILGAGGMLGHAMLRELGASPGVEVFGTVRSGDSYPALSRSLAGSILHGVDVTSIDAVHYAIRRSRPNVVVNCVGVIKQVDAVKDPVTTITINALLPHRLAAVCELAKARLLHFSTDCVFSGSKGRYIEGDFADADDLYGRSKLLGEINYPHALTLRTSIIGHELNSNRALIDWFLAQQGSCRGFTRAVFSGLPTVTLSRVIRDYVLPRGELHGVYHVSAEPITKFDLLTLVRDVYGKQIRIEPSQDVVIDRSLDSARFRQATGWQPPPWPELIREMYLAHRQVAAADTQG